MEQHLYGAKHYLVIGFWSRERIHEMIRLLQLLYALLIKIEIVYVYKPYVN